MKRMRYELGLGSVLMIGVLVGWMGSPAQANSSSTTACIAETTYTPHVKNSGYNGTSETSYQAAGPITINYTELATAAQTFGVNTSASVSASAIIASAEVTFGVDYSYTASATKSWSYSTTIPAGKTGVLAVLHREHRDSFTKETLNPNCTYTTVNFYAYIPVAATQSTDFCIIRDLSPYGYMTWRSACTGE
jgi:hypothetical protein